MTVETNQEIVDRYLQRFAHSMPSLRGRKYGLRYFFESRYFGYDKHVFEMKKRDAVDFFDYLNQLDNIAFQTKINKWNIFRSFLQFVMEYYEDFLIAIPRYPIQSSQFLLKNSLSHRLHFLLRKEGGLQPM